MGRASSRVGSHQNYVSGSSFDLLIESVERTARLIVIDEPKAYLKMADHVIA